MMAACTKAHVLMAARLSGRLPVSLRRVHARCCSRNGPCARPSYVAVERVASILHVHRPLDCDQRIQSPSLNSM